MTAQSSDISSHTLAEGKPTLSGLLAECVRLDASDLHIAPGVPPYFRTHGSLEPRTARPALSPDEIDHIVNELLAERDRSALLQKGAIDGAVSSQDGARFRFNIYRRQDEHAIAFRKLEDRFRTLGELGLPESLYALSEITDGLVVVVGPTGSGKSTTLATIIDRINSTRKAHVITIEDPIEYVHRPKQALVNQRQIGSDASGFNDALVSSLRQDPDVILVGEIRDLETIRTAITASETGHLVFTTVHAGDCVGAIERMVSVFPSDEQEGVRRQLALVLRAVITQHLLICDGEGPRRPADRDRRRAPASEVLFINPAVANLIALAKSAQIYSAMESGAGAGMQTLEHDLARLVNAHLISERTALAVTRNPGVLRDRIALLKRNTAPAVGGRR